MEMDDKYFHIRKDGIMTEDRNNILMKCNNGVKNCKWRRILNFRRFLTYHMILNYTVDTLEIIPVQTLIPGS